MAEISRFFGIIVTMYPFDHEPPHFHARYGSQSVAVFLDGSWRVRGEMGRRALNLVLEWAELHAAELVANVARARRQEPLQPIAPLE